MIEIEKQIIKARGALILDEPFFGSLTLKLTIIHDNKRTKTIATNGRDLVYNSDYIETCSMDETKGLNAHETLHCVFGHHVNRGARDKDIWNQACDYVINPILLDAGFTLPKGYLFNKDFIGKSTDEVYNILYQKKQQEKGNQGEGKDNQQNNASQTSPNAPQNDKGKSQGNDKGQDKNPLPGEVLDMPGGDDLTGISQSEKDLEQQEWQIAATQAANQAKACGKLPGSLAQLIKDLNEPKVNWKEALHRFVEQVSKNDYSFKRPNARYASFGVLLPSLYNHELGPIDLYVDTSGSIGVDELKQFASELDDILNQYNTTARVIYCDTRVTAVETFTSENRPIVLHAKGGGGTDFAPAIEWSMKQDDLPCCGIYLTDMCCSSFGKEPDFPMLWVSTENTRKQPPFGELIKMKSFI